MIFKNDAKSVFGGNLLNIVQATSIDLQPLAIRIGIGQNTLYNYTRKTHTVSARIDTLDVIADYLGVETWELLKPMTVEEWKERLNEKR